ncbi:ABC transporter permease, partial [Actinomadura sediminis]
MTSYRPALRIAWRDALRAKGRTALILCMVGLPVAAVVGFGVVWKTLEWTPRESLPHEIGAADALLGGSGRDPIRQHPYNGDAMAVRPGPPGDARAWTTAEITRRVVAEYGADARVLPMNFGDVEIVTSAGRLRVPLHELDVRDPMARGILEITDGRAPGAPGEIALSPSLAARGFALGGSVRVGSEETPMRVVGYVRDPYTPGGGKTTENLALTLPGAVPAGAAESNTSRKWLIDAGGPVTWEDVTAFNEDGIMVLSRDVVEHPPGAAGAGRAEAIDLSSPPEWPATRTGTVVALAGAMIALEIVLLAGPALAVDVRRRRRLLALVAVAGGGPRHLRAVVLAGG